MDYKAAYGQLLNAVINDADNVSVPVLEKAQAINNALNEGGQADKGEQAPTMSMEDIQKETDSVKRVELIRQHHMGGKQ